MFALAWASQHVFTCIQAIDIARPSSCKEDNCFPPAPSLCQVAGTLKLELAQYREAARNQHTDLLQRQSPYVSCFFMFQNGHTPGVDPSISDTRSGRYFSMLFTDRRMWSKSQDIWMTDSMKGVQLHLWPWYNMKPVQMSLMRSGTTCAFVCSNPRFCPCCQPLSRLRPLLSSVLI
jgi:hypothetical protein